MTVWSAPGSLLLTGEYLVTETGGRGLALACSPRGRLILESTDQTRIHGLWGDGEIDWTPGNKDKLIDAVSAALRRRDLHAADIAGYWHLDTRTFSRQDGQKSGFGSSAVSVLLSGRALADRRIPGDALAEALIEAHRLFQGGRGSGYDILCSLKGGAGLFTGGEHPDWEPILWPKGLELYLIPGPAPVRSSDAVAKYGNWKSEDPGGWLQYRNRADNLTKNLLRLLRQDPVIDLAALIHCVDELGRHSRLLGEKIGVPALPVLPESLDIVVRDGMALKCLGAGDELSLLVTGPGVLNRAEKERIKSHMAAGLIRRIVPENRGLSREDAR